MQTGIATNLSTAAGVDVILGSFSCSRESRLKKPWAPLPCLAFATLVSVSPSTRFSGVVLVSIAFHAAIAQSFPEAFIPILAHQSHGRRAGRSSRRGVGGDACVCVVRLGRLASLRFSSRRLATALFSEPSGTLWRLQCQTPDRCRRLPAGVCRNRPAAIGNGHDGPPGPPFTTRAHWPSS